MLGCRQALPANLDARHVTDGIPWLWLKPAPGNPTHSHLPHAIQAILDTARNPVCCPVHRRLDLGVRDLNLESTRPRQANFNSTTLVNTTSGPV
jgi:hypothetical protein